MQHEDGGPWTHGILKEAKSKDHRGGSFIIRVTIMGRLLTWNTRHICSTPITTEQYLQEQIRKGAWLLEDIFLQTVPVEQKRIPRSHTPDPRTHVS